MSTILRQLSGSSWHEWQAGHVKSLSVSEATPKGYKGRRGNAPALIETALMKQNMLGLCTDTKINQESYPS
jgi:hypothetical protein